MQVRGFQDHSFIVLLDGLIILTGFYQNQKKLKGVRNHHKYVKGIYVEFHDKTQKNREEAVTPFPAMVLLGYRYSPTPIFPIYFPKCMNMEKREVRGRAPRRRYGSTSNLHPCPVSMLLFAYDDRKVDSSSGKDPPHF